MNGTKRAVVLLSGGLDSTTTLAIARALGFETFAASVSRPERRRRETILGMVRQEWEK